jgi:hypothetical protein
MVHRTGLVYAVSLIGLLQACQAPLNPSVSAVAGIYNLRMVVDPLRPSSAPVSGRITLTSAGSAERRVSYRVDTLGTLHEYVTLGTFSVTDSLVRMTLHQVGQGQSFQVVAVHQPDGWLRIAYQGPADEPIVELYQPQ